MIKDVHGSPFPTAASASYGQETFSEIHYAKGDTIA